MNKSVFSLFLTFFWLFFTIYDVCFGNDLKEIKCRTKWNASVTAPIATVAAIIFAGIFISAWHVFSALSEFSQWGSDKWSGLNFLVLRICFICWRNWEQEKEKNYSKVVLIAACWKKTVRPNIIQLFWNSVSWFRLTASGNVVILYSPLYLIAWTCFLKCNHM